jgi:rhamnose utilization protein RhaD (predicted bifunctional aldolase and dehydrogenase)
MINLWNEKFSEKLNSDIDYRVYTSNLLGKDDSLVLHGGGNTSVKLSIDGEEILYVKGSGWDLSSIKPEGFAPVKLSTLLEMVQEESMTDMEMVTRQRAAMVDNTAPNPSIEAILHAIIPFKFVDHTHADAVVTISNSMRGKEIIKELYPDFLIIDYVMPGFELAKAIYNAMQELSWDNINGIILHNHGIFTFDDSAKESYNKMLNSVEIAEKYLDNNAVIKVNHNYMSKDLHIVELVNYLSELKSTELKFIFNNSPLAKLYSSQDNLEKFATRGVLTPEHVLRTKIKPLILDSEDDYNSKIESYIEDYKNYFSRYSTDEIMLNPAPNYIIIRNKGIITLGKTEKEAQIINDIIQHTMLSVLRADKLGGYKSISEQDTFAIEYWELEQAKIKK